MINSFFPSLPYGRIPTQLQRTCKSLPLLRSKQEKRDLHKRNQKKISVQQSQPNHRPCFCKTLQISRCPKMEVVTDYNIMYFLYMHLFFASLFSHQTL